MCGLRGGGESRALRSKTIVDPLATAPSLGKKLTNVIKQQYTSWFEEPAYSNSWHYFQKERITQYQTSEWHYQHDQSMS